MMIACVAQTASNWTAAPHIFIQTTQQQSIALLRVLATAAATQIHCILHCTGGTHKQQQQCKKKRCVSSVLFIIFQSTCAARCKERGSSYRILGAFNIDACCGGFHMCFSL